MIAPTQRRLLEACLERRMSRAAFSAAKLRPVHGINALRSLRSAGLLSVEIGYDDDILEATEAGRKALEH